MNRVERYREIRKRRRKFSCTILLCFLITAFGIFMVDYSINQSLTNEGELKVVYFNSSDDGLLELNMMNKKVTLNMYYLRRDLENLYNRINQKSRGRFF